MEDFYFQFASFEEAQDLAAEFLNDEGFWIRSHTEYALDPVGEIEGLSGYHLNLRTSKAFCEALNPALLSKIVNPENPRRLWA